jgi:hypothetical protein
MCSPPAAAASNNTPCTNTLLSLQNNCGGTFHTNVGATNSGITPLPACGGYNTTGGNTNNHSRDVWFRFVAGPTGTVHIQSFSGTLTNGAMAVYSAASCNGPFSLIACDDNSGMNLMPHLTLNGLTPGTSYYLRYWGNGNSTGTFSLCVQGVVTLPPGDCVYLLNLFDSFGDGWGSSSVGVGLGGPVQNYSTTARARQVAIGVNIGQTIVLNYNASGTFQSQNSYNLGLHGGGGVYFNSGSPPASGIVYTQSVNCAPPPAAQEDCIGSHTVCSTENVSNSTTNTGNVADLNGSNAGCLANAERQGTWYNFSSTTNGTVAFTISPTDPTDDYDFAVWGPYPSTSSVNDICPPASAPIRCSYSGQTGDTGLNMTATDLSEGALGDKWVRYLDVQAGDIYLLYVSNWSQSGLAFDLNWNISAGTTMDCTPLPVELLRFEVEETNGAVLATWTTASEWGSDSFILERSADGLDFVPIGSVPAAGHTTWQVDYEFTDGSPRTGLNYYRLQQVDLDGSAHIGPVRWVELRGIGPVIYPNPCENVLHMAGPAGTGASWIRLADMQGRIIRSWRPAEAEIITLNMEGVAGGHYVIVVDGLEGYSKTRMPVTKR